MTKYKSAWRLLPVLLCLAVAAPFAGRMAVWAGLRPEPTYTCLEQQLTQAQIASRFEMPSADLDLLRTTRRLTPTDICTLTPKQVWANLERAHRYTWLERMFGPEVDEEEEEGDGDKPAQDYPREAAAWRNLSLVDENGYIPPNALMSAKVQMNAMIQAAQSKPVGAVAGISTTSWTSLGPGNIGGRIRAILIHPTTTTTMWVGSVTGGIWKSTDSGANWSVVNDFMSNLSVTSLVMNSQDTSILYASTGEGFVGAASGARGAGIFKSTDGGTTWAQLSGTANANFYYVNRLAIAANGTTLLAATATGIWRSADSGSSWTQVLASVDMADIDFAPSSSLNAVAGQNSGGLTRYSTDGGTTWTSVATGASGRVEVAYAASNTAVIYASVNINLGEVWKSTNSGVSYTRMNTGSNYFGSGVGQGWYDNALWVSPTDPTAIIVGGIDLWKSTNSGTTLTQISYWGFGGSYGTNVHADQHVIVSHPNFAANSTVFFGNDGGVFKAADWTTVTSAASGHNWTILNTGLAITQFYSGAYSPSGKVLGGTQDNGSLVYTPANGVNAWADMFGGDGGWSAADSVDSNYLYGEYTYLQIHRSTNGGGGSILGSGTRSASYIYEGISDATSAGANFIAPFIIDPNSNTTMYAGGARLWKTTTLKATTPTWSSIKAATVWGSFISAIAVAPGNSSVIWVGHNDGDIYYSADAGANWTQKDTTTPALPDRTVTRLTIDPNNNAIVYATFGGFSADNVYRSTNSGTTWADITGTGTTGLPNIPIRSLVINPSNSAKIYVGGETGVFASEDSGANWSVSNDGPANVSVDELFYGGTTLYAATYGRGIWVNTTAAAGALVIVESGTGTTVDKGGTTDTYTVKLASAPSGNVVVTVGENSQLSTSPKVLTFTTANYATAQTVTVSAVNDNRYEVSHTATLTHSVSSSDTNYNGLSSTALTVTITSPTPGTGRVAMLESGGTTLVGEGDATDTYTLVLSEAPTSTLLIRVGDGLPDLAEHQVLFTTKLTTTASNTATLEFDSSNFSVPQTVTVTAVNDSYGEGRHSAVITGLIISTSSANYLSVQVPSFTAVIEDNDQTLVLTQSAGSTDVAEGGLTDSYTVNLSLQPTGTVVVYAGGGQASGSAEQLTFLPASLTFSNTNYAVPQVVTVTALDDSTVEGYHTGVITHSVWPSAGFNNLASVASTRITVNIDDNDSNVAIVETGTSTHTVRFAETLPSIALKYGIVLETLLKSNPGVSAELLKIGDVLQLPTNNTTRTVVREGGGITDTYTVFLLTAPTGNVSVTLGDGMYALQVTPSGTDPGYSHDVTFTTAGTTTATSTVTLTFTPANYSTPQTVTVLALDDALKEGVEKVSITHHVRSVSNTGRTNVVIDSRYNETVANRVIVTVLDNDVGIATMGADFDGDGKTDYAIYRASSAQYFVRKSLDSSAEVLTWGDAAQADRPVPADYDGDGKSDYAVYRPGTAQFLVRKSSSGIAEVVTWGIAGGGDRPAVADFDGDGRVDYAIYRSTTAQFIVKNSADNSATDFTWGVANGSDTPVVGDYDGDGKADYAVYRRPTAQWFIKQSSNGSVVVTAWGMARSADIPVPGDYDGDGKIDLAIFRPETAEFFVRQSSNVIVAVTRWGIAGGGDVPVPGDYDGDGKMDKAIFRPSTAAFIVQKSSTLTAIDPPATWGVAGGFDYPLPVPDPNFDGTVYGFIGQ